VNYPCWPGARRCGHGLREITVESVAVYRSEAPRGCDIVALEPRGLGTQCRSDPAADDRGLGRQGVMAFSLIGSISSGPAIGEVHRPGRAEGARGLGEGAARKRNPVWRVYPRRCRAAAES